MGLKCPCAFDSAMLLVDIISMGVEPLKVQLWFLNIWIQIHDLLSDFMTEVVGKQLEFFFLVNFCSMIKKKCKYMA